MPEDLVLYVAAKAAGTANPTAYVNRVLASYKQEGIATVAQAEEQVKQHAAEKPTANKPTTPPKKLIGGVEIQRRDYSDDELHSLFTALDDTEE